MLPLARAAAVSTRLRVLRRVVVERVDHHLPLVRVDRAVEPLELHVVLLEQLAEEIERLREVGHEDPSIRGGLLHLWNTAFG